MQKNLTLLLVVMSLLALGACNRSRSLEVKSIKLISYQLKGLESVDDSKALKGTLENLQGVTAAAVNFNSKLAAITFYPDETNERKIRNVIAQTPGLEVKDYIIKSKPNKAKCPAKGLREWFSFNN